MKLDEQIKEAILNLDNSLKALKISIQQLEQAARKMAGAWAKPKLVVDNEKEEKENRT